MLPLTFAGNSTIYPITQPPNTFFLRTSWTATGWTPNLVTKTGGILTWTVYDQNGTQVLQTTANKPTFNLSSYPGIKTMVVTSPDGWSGFTAFSAVSKKVTHVNITYCTGLISFTVTNDTLTPWITEIDVSQNTNLTTLNLGSNSLNKIDVSGLNNLGTLSLSQNDLLEIGGLAGLTQLTALDYTNNQTTSAGINAILAALILNEAAGDPGRDATIQLTENAPPTGQGLTDVATLITKDWSVLVDA